MSSALRSPIGTVRAVPSSGRTPGASASTRSQPRARPDLLMFALAAMILTYVWRFQDLFPILGKVRLPLLAAAAALGLFFFDPHPLRRMSRLHSPIVKLLFGLAAIMALGVPFALWRGKSFVFLTQDFGPSLVMALLLGASVRDEADLRFYLFVHLVGATVFSALVLVRYPVVNGRLGNLVYYDSNDLALLLVSAIPIAVYFVTRAPGTLKKIAVGLCLPVIVLTIVKTGSRGGFIGLCVVGLYVLFKYKGVALGKRLAALAVVGVLFVGFAGGQYWQMMSTLLHPTQDYNWSGNSESGRMEVWKRGIGYMLTHPIFGVGVRNFPQAEGALSREGQLNKMGGAGFKWSAAHNSFVEIGAETGVIGLILFVALLFQGFRFGSRSSNRSRDGPPSSSDIALNRMFVGALLGFVVCGFFLSAAYKAYLYTILGLIVGLEKLRELRARREASAPDEAARGLSRGAHPLGPAIPIGVRPWSPAPKRRPGAPVARRQGPRPAP